MITNIVGSRGQISKFASEQRVVATGVTVSDGDFVTLVADTVTNASISTVKPYGLVEGGDVVNLVSRNYRAPQTLGDGTKKVLVQLCEGYKYAMNVNGSLPASAVGQYFTLVPTSQAVLTSDATAPAVNDTVTIGGQVYVFKSTLTGAANEVFINTTAAAALINLKKAINASGTAGTDYGTGTVANASVTATTITTTSLVVTAITQANAGNLVSTSASSAHLSFDTPNLTGGTGYQSINLLSQSSTIGQFLCTGRTATNTAGTVFNKGIFVVAIPEEKTTLS